MKLPEGVFLAAENAGLTLGTWRLAITHASVGKSVNSPAWEESVQCYLEKYKEANL